MPRDPLDQTSKVAFSTTIKISTPSTTDCTVRVLKALDEIDGSNTVLFQDRHLFSAGGSNQAFKLGPKGGEVPYAV